MNTKNKSKIGKKIGIAMTAIMIASIFAISVPTLVAAPEVPAGEEGIYFLVPNDSSATGYGSSKTIDVWVNSSVLIDGGKATIETSDKSCGNITSSSYNSSFWTQFGTAVIKEGGKQAWITFGIADDQQPGNYNIGTITVQCNSSTYCMADLNFVSETYITNSSGQFNRPGENGTFTCTEAVHDVYIDTGYTGTHGTGIRIDTATDEKIPLDQNLTIGETYFIKYKVFNNGTAGPEDVNITVKVSNATGWSAELAKYPKTININHYGDVTWSTTGLAPGNYNITVNASIADDAHPADNERTREVTLESPPEGVEVKIDCGVAAPDSSISLPITMVDIADYGSGTINVEYDPLVVRVDSASSGPGSTVSGYEIDNSAGIVNISAWNTNGVSGDVIFANVTFTAIGSRGQCSPLNLTVKTLDDIEYNQLYYYTTNCLLCIIEDVPPIVSNPSANPSRILNDNGRARVSGTNVSQLSVYVADDTGVASVTVNLTPIWGPGNDDVLMTRTVGGDKSGIWSRNVTATYDAGVDQTHCLAVNATDIFGNSNTAKCISLTVLRRGDVVRNNAVTITDAYYIAQYTVGIVSAPDEFVAGVVPADSYNGVTMADALYIARYFTDPGVLEDAP